MSLESKTAERRKQEIDAQMDPAKGMAEKQLKTQLVGDKHSNLLMIAQRIAHDLAQNGPVTADEVTRKMAEQYDVLPAKLEKGKEQRWKGGIFAKGEWVLVGSLPAVQATSHGRRIGLWALKTWLRNNTMNGKESSVSAFVLTRIYRDFTKHNPTIATDISCEWLIGREQLSAEIEYQIKAADNTLYGIPVLRSGGVGAILRLKQEARQ